VGEIFDLYKYRNVKRIKEGLEKVEALINPDVDRINKLLRTSIDHTQILEQHKGYHQTLTAQQDLELRIDAFVALLKMRTFLQMIEEEIRIFCRQDGSPRQNSILTRSRTNNWLESRTLSRPSRMSTASNHHYKVEFQTMMSTNLQSCCVLCTSPSLSQSTRSTHRLAQDLLVSTLQDESGCSHTIQLANERVLKLEPTKYSVYTIRQLVAKKFCSNKYKTLSVRERNPTQHGPRMSNRVGRTPDLWRIYSTRPA